MEVTLWPVLIIHSILKLEVIMMIVIEQLKCGATLCPVLLPDRPKALVNPETS